MAGLQLADDGVAISVGRAAGMAASQRVSDAHDSARRGQGGLVARSAPHAASVVRARLPYHLDREASIDQAALRFDPFRGVFHPVELVHAIRRATYASGQAARPARESGTGSYHVHRHAERQPERVRIDRV